MQNRYRRLLLAMIVLLCAVGGLAGRALALTFTEFPISTDSRPVGITTGPDGALWLGKRRSAEQAAAMEVQVYRLVRDDIPTYLLTRIRLNVAGDAREELLGRVLPDGFTPLSLTGAVPARLERDGRLRAQVRAGSHEIVLVARASGVVNTLMRPPAGEGEYELARAGLRVAAGLRERVLGGAGDGEGFDETIVERLRGPDQHAPEGAGRVAQPAREDRPHLARVLGAKGRRQQTQERAVESHRLRRCAARSRSPAPAARVRSAAASPPARRRRRTA